MGRIFSEILNPTPQQLLHTEWLVANGLGGFASSSISCSPMRKYHGLLIAALPAPFGRSVMLNHAEETLILSDNREIPLTFVQISPDQELHNTYLKRFRVEEGIAFWTFEVEGIVLERSLFFIHNQNTVHINYKILEGDKSVSLRWRPFLHFLTNEQTVNIRNEKETYSVSMQENQYEIASPPFPPLRIYSFAQAPFTSDVQVIENAYYAIEDKRGYPCCGPLTSPGYFTLTLEHSRNSTLVASIESWKNIHVLNHEEAFSLEKHRVRNILKTSGKISSFDVGATLVFAADQFIMMPKARDEDNIRLQALGEEIRSIIAGFPWFMDWGRDTMISLEGLTITTGRLRIAASILRTFAYYVKDGLLPNMFKEGVDEAVYNTADATLWFFHAANRYIEASGDEDILEILLPKFQQIVDHHIRGTRFGIHVDADGLLKQGQPDVALTWMDAKKDNIIVTPRRGKAVEINALWYNALKLLESWTGKKNDIAEKCYDSFNKRFWYEKEKYLYDVVDGEKGDDASLRPNQLFAISLKHPVLDPSRWEPVLTAVQSNLLTPFGLRTLASNHPDYKPYYAGDLLSRDMAYHQGTVWPWLLGPFIDVFLKVHPNDLESAKSFLKGLETQLVTYCCGTFAEIFDADDPHHARGCFAQAWSVAEYLRCYAKAYL